MLIPSQTEPPEPLAVWFVVHVGKVTAPGVTICW